METMTPYEKLREHYDELALSGDDRVTARDYNLRDLEIDLASEYIRDRDTLLDVGCGLGFALRQYVVRRRLSRSIGIDYSFNMVKMASRKNSEVGLDGKIELECASVTEMAFPDDDFDVVTSHRCLLALLSWERQKKALFEIHRVLKPGGILVLMEATVDGLERLNFYRRAYALPEIGIGGRDGYERLLFEETKLFSFLDPLFETLRVQRYGMYYFLTRIVQPLFVEPDEPRYDHRLNDVARRIARITPDFESIGHEIHIVLRKRI